MKCWLVLLFLPQVMGLWGCNGEGEDTIACSSAADCPGLWVCESGECLEVCSSDDSCTSRGEGAFCVYGGCTDKEFSGPFHVSIAGADEVDEQSLVLLDGSASVYVGSAVVTGQWVQVKGNPVTITPEKAPFSASFTAPRVFSDEQLLFELVLDDGEQSVKRQKNILVRDAVNEAPVISVISPDEPVREGDFVALDARGTFDPNPGDPIQLLWSQELGPQVSLGELGGGVPGAYVGFVAPPVDSLIKVSWTLQAVDARGGISSEIVEVSVRDLNTVSCEDVADCITGAACVWMVCSSEGLCLESTLGWCCSADRPCDDGDPCTLDHCDPDAGCIREPIPGCCSEDSECPDPGECRVPKCSDEGACSSEWLEGCCTEDSHCPKQGDCTTSVCVDGACEFFEQPDCCMSDQDCASSETCSQAYCDPWTNSCRIFPLPGCCDEQSDCGSEALCIADSCDLDSNTCVRETLWGCCSAENSGCEDNNPCTRDECDLATGACIMEAVEGCCRSANDCPEAPPCTETFCQENICFFAPVPGCCDPSSADSDIQCDDSNPCTVDVCDAAAGACRNYIDGDCCELDADCEDGNPCTFDRCSSDTRTCAWFPDIGCCEADEQCDDKNPCTEDRCFEGSCQHNPREDCCSSNHQCRDDDPCTADQCDSSGQCVHTEISSCCSSDSDCEDGSEVCTVARCSLIEGKCVSYPDPNCCVSDEMCAPAGACVLRFCTGGACDSLALPACCQEASDCDDGNPCTEDSCDAASFQCLNQPIQNCCREDGDCTTEEPCVDAVCDGDPGQCQEVIAQDCCQDDEDCESPNPCMIASCQQGRCSQDPVPNCCFVKEDCILADSCQANDCSGFVCSSQQLPGCCLEDSECDDGDICTDDRCDGRTRECIFIESPGCCNTSDDCSDGSPCTDDQCLEQQCVHALKAGACCEEPLDCDDADPCTVDICRPSDGLCESFSLPSCCFEDSDCSVDSCEQAFCDPFAQACVTVDVPGCCQTSADCPLPDDCRTASCIEGQCVQALLESCCIADEDCDDGNSCTLDRCDESGRCLHTPTLPHTQCDDGEIFTSADSCSDQGRCSGYYTWLLPESLGPAVVLGFSEGGGGLLGLAQNEQEGAPIWLPYHSEGYPFGVEFLSSAGVVDLSNAYMLTTAGEILKAPAEESASPSLLFSIQDKLPSMLGVSWKSLLGWENSSTGAEHLVIAGEGLPLLGCLKSAPDSDWDCSEDDIEGADSGTILDLARSESGEIWALLRLDSGPAALYAKNIMDSSWTLKNSPVCSSVDTDCPEQQPDRLWAGSGSGGTVYAFGLSAPLMRLGASEEWVDITPPFMATNQKISIRDLAELPGLLQAIAYERQCSLSTQAGDCVLELGRWWLVSAAVTGDSLVWSEPTLLHEESCGQGLTNHCTGGEANSGPFRLQYLSELDAWFISGSIWGEQGPRGIIFWKP